MSILEETIAARTAAENADRAKQALIAKSCNDGSYIYQVEQNGLPTP